VREATGAEVCWLIREGLDSEKALKALFGLPAVRFRVIDRDDPGRLLAPWEHPPITCLPGATPGVRNDRARSPRGKAT